MTRTIETITDNSIDKTKIGLYTYEQMKNKQKRQNFLQGYHKASPSPEMCGVHLWAG